MRELTKSMLSLSWAMSLLGLKQMASLLVPGNTAAASFEAVTRCTEEQLGASTRPAFRAGDNLQRGLVDLTFAVLTFGLWQPGPRRGNCAGCAPSSSMGAGAGAMGADATRAAGDLTAQAMGAGIDLMQQGVNLAYQMVGGAPPQPSRNTGWGPVPPPGGGQAGGV